MTRIKNLTRDVLDTLYGNSEIQVPEVIFSDPQSTQNKSHLVEQSPEISEILEQEIIPSAAASEWEDGFKGKDLRPRLKDGNVTYLLDSGSMACVWPKNGLRV